MELIMQVFGFTFVGVILVCIAWTIAEYIYQTTKKIK